MDKKELIGFILNDIKELGFIAEGMHEMDKIPEVMQELAVSKTQNILDKFCQLKEKQKEEVLPEEVWTEKESILVFDDIVEPVEEEEKSPVSQNIEVREEKTVTQSLLLFAEEEAEEKILPVAGQQPEEENQQPEEVDQQPEEENQQPEEIDQQPKEENQQPEEEKGTIIVQEEIKVQERTTNEKFKFRIPAVNPAIATGRRTESRFVQNLRKAINLNDRYRYQKELFGGSIELMNKVIDKLDAMKSLEEAMAYVQREFAWDAESGTVADFYLLLESRFS